MRTRFCLAIAGLAAVAGTIAIAQPPSREPAKPAQPPAKPAQPANPDHAVPPGMSEADMQACIAAATPGPEHAFLTQQAGVWQGKMKMWMAPGAPAEESTCTTTITPILDGRFVRCETTGEMPGGMGAFTGYGINGFDNVAREYQGTWIDNMGTGMATGKGEKSADGKTVTWKLSYNCPIKKGPITIRQVERRTGDNSMTLEMHMPDPASGKEYKMMEISYTRQPKSGDATR